MSTADMKSCGSDRGVWFVGEDGRDLGVGVDVIALEYFNKSLLYPSKLAREETLAAL